VIKLVALFAAYRLLRRVVTIAIVGTLALLLLSGTRDAAGRRGQGRAVRQPQNAARPLEQLLQHTLQKATGR
jgi:hypothetical protein